MVPWNLAHLLDRHIFLWWLILHRRWSFVFFPSSSHFSVIALYILLFFVAQFPPYFKRKFNKTSVVFVFVDIDLSGGGFLLFVSTFSCGSSNVYVDFSFDIIYSSKSALLCLNYFCTLFKYASILSACFHCIFVVWIRALV